MATLASASKKQKTDHGKKLPVNTFLKWNVQNIFDYETETVEGTSYVIKIKCKMCVKHIDYGTTSTSTICTCINCISHQS